MASLFFVFAPAGDVEVPGLYIDRLPKCSKGQTPERKNPFYDGAACRAAKEFRHPAVSKDTLRPRRQQKGMFQRRKVPGGSAPFFKVPVSVTAGTGILLFQMYSIIRKVSKKIQDIGK